ncbi:DUF262 domain-containing protein [Deinococcus sp. 23YEL01]|uniref:DUF262 domain-containing protein n=1 Tax=Deinococcus sp. 23YEL01 TaxID=2745871 RepID=UPI001E64513E|nr:DUF262 domain-containing protein [Deinococcus sp. 23YEL01]MCD0169468.1 DUF262 domain-containing protein [Deinococcus sp. 23YEL01]
MSKKSDIEAVDIDEESDEIEESGISDIDFWENKQREIFTSVVDFNLGTLTDLIEDDIVDLKPKYQRRFRWDNIRRSKLIESFLMNVPVPPVFFNEDEYGNYSVIDGKQRLAAVHDYIKGRFALEGLTVFHELNNKTFDEIHKSLRGILRTRPTIRAIIILKQSDSDIKFEVFQRLNTGGVKLNAQEIRNSAFTGSFNDFLLEVSENKLFHSMLGIKKKSESKFYQEMRDAEFALRYFVFAGQWENYDGGMKRWLDGFMNTNRNVSDDRLKEYESDFISTLQVVNHIFGTDSFSRWLPEASKWRNQPIAALFDTQMLALSGTSLEEVVGKEGAIISGYKNLFNNPDFRKSIDAATNTPSFFKYRVEAFRSVISEILKK